MTFEEWLQDWEDKIQNIQSTIMDMAMEVVLIGGKDAIAIIRKRVQYSGIDANGQAFSPYTKAYAARKKAMGHDVSIVNLTLSGEMWKRIDITSHSRTDWVAEVTISGTNDFTQVKLNSNRNTGRSALGLSKKEYEELKDQMIEQLKSRLVEHFRT